MPTVTTIRLLLRPFVMTDAPDVQRLCNEREIALNTLLIPHPYPEGKAEEWIANGPSGFAVTLKDGGTLVGCIGIHVQPDHDRAEIGYWIGVPFWGKGYATEAVRAVIAHGFDTLGLNRIYAEVFTRNPASARVLEKAGMQREGTLRQAVKKWGEYVDCEMYAIIRPRD